VEPSPRHRARELALQGLYALECGQGVASDIIEDVISGNDLSEKSLRFARDLFTLVSENTEWADAQIVRLAENWDLRRIATIDRTILHMALVELDKTPDIPVKVVINEAIELAKTFSTSQSFSFINGILDRFVKDMEGGESG
jgi:N utilization substance protein B